MHGSLTDRQNVVGWWLVLNYKQTPPIHYYLESSGPEVHMETRPKFHGIGRGSQQRSNEHQNSTCVLDLSLTMCTIYNAYTGQSNRMAPLNFKVHIQIHSEKPEWLNTPPIHLAANTVFLLVLPTQHKCAVSWCTFPALSILILNTNNAPSEAPHLRRHTMPCILLVFHIFNIWLVLQYWY